MRARGHEPYRRSHDRRGSARGCARVLELPNEGVDGRRRVGRRRGRWPRGIDRRSRPPARGDEGSHARGSCTLRRIVGTGAVVGTTWPVFREAVQRWSSARTSPPPRAWRSHRPPASYECQPFGNGGWPRSDPTRNGAWRRLRARLACVRPSDDPGATPWARAPAACRAPRSAAKERAVSSRRRKGRPVRAGVSTAYAKAGEPCGESKRCEPFAGCLGGTCTVPTFACP